MTGSLLDTPMPDDPFDLSGQVAVLCLASPASRFINGTTIIASGTPLALG